MSETSELREFINGIKQHKSHGAELKKSWGRIKPFSHDDIPGEIERLLRKNENIYKVKADIGDTGEDLGIFWFHPGRGEGEIILNPSLRNPVGSRVGKHEAYHIGSLNRAGSSGKSKIIEGGFMQSPEEIIIDSTLTTLSLEGPIPRKIIGQEIDANSTCFPGLTRYDFDLQVLAQDYSEFILEADHIQNIRQVDFEIITKKKVQHIVRIVVNNKSGSWLNFSTRGELTEWQLNTDCLRRIGNLLPNLCNYLALDNCQSMMEKFDLLNNSTLKLRVYVDKEPNPPSIDWSSHMQSVRIRMRDLEGVGAFVNSNIDKISKFLVCSEDRDKTYRHGLALNPWVSEDSVEPPKGVTYSVLDRSLRSYDRGGTAKMMMRLGEDVRSESIRKRRRAKAFFS